MISVPNILASINPATLPQVGGYPALDVSLIDQNFAALIAIQTPLAKTSSYAPVQTDMNNILGFNSGSAVTCTLSSGLTNGSWLWIINLGSGLLSFSPSGSGSSFPTLAQYQSILVYTDGTNWWILSSSLPLLNLSSIQTGNYTSTLADLGKTILLNPSAAATLTLPGSPPAGWWARFRNLNTAINAYTVQWQNTIDGISNPYMLGADWTLWWDGTYWHAQIPPVQEVPITPTALLSSGTQTSFTSLSAAAIIPAMARYVWGTIFTSAATGVAYLSPTSNGNGQVNASVGTGGNGMDTGFYLPLITAQTLWYKMSGLGNLSVVISGYAF